MRPTSAISRQTGSPSLLQLATLLCALGLLLPRVAGAEVIYTGLIAYYDLAIDPAGHAHAFLDDVDHDQLYYRNNVGGVWSFPVNLGHTSDWGELNVSGAVDASGRGHVAFDGGRAIDDLFYGTNRSGSWVTSSVRQGVTWYSLALGPLPQELPRAAYYDGYSGLNYGAMAGDGSWSNVLVDGSGEVTTFAGRYPDLEVDGADHGHISYYYYVDSQIRYATNASGSWQWEIVVTDPLVLPESYLSIEPDGSVVICYSTQEGIYIARKSGGVWNSKIVAPIGVYGTADLGVMNDGRAVVVYDDWMAAKTYLAVETGGTFYTREILPHTADGGGPSLVVQGQTAHVLAWDQNAQRVEYVTESLDLAGVEDGIAPSSKSLRVMPNPITPSTLIALTPGRPGPLSLEIVDVAGRLVRGWSGESSGGEVRLNWSDLVGGGRLAAGSYYCRVKGGRTNDAERIVVLK